MPFPDFSHASPVICVIEDHCIVSSESLFWQEECTLKDFNDIDVMLQTEAYYSIMVSHGLDMIGVRPLSFVLSLHFR